MVSTISGALALSGAKEAPLMSKSSTLTADADLLPNPTPGEVLLEDFLKPMGLSQNELARA
jgi:plasmid maintenance system antidote protein VapI